MRKTTNSPGEKIVEETIAVYTARIGKPPLRDGMPELKRRLTEAQIELIREVIDEHQDEINVLGIGFKGFVPAIFDRLVNERFAELAGDQARVKITVPVDLVRNHKSRPDKWERSVIEEHLLSLNWPAGEAFTQEATTKGRPAFRILLPEITRLHALRVMVRLSARSV